MKPEVFQEAVNALQKRAAVDEQFRELAKSDAHAALSQVGADLPATAKVRFVEPQEGITIPLTPQTNGDDELSDEQLENASGGTFYNTMNCIHH